ncbi:MAG TPA: hypothetical protein VE360_06860 [Pyrinomonadaceae bacterium]|jgi:hypothetical protein|nr:hypothetical protein [Pyrinomonadaceae bacterium]
MTRRFLVGCSLACALLFAVAASAAAPTNFAGTWVLDKSKSKDLPQQWVDNLESYTLTVTQDEKQLTVDNKLNWKEGAAPMSGGGGQGSGGPGGGGGGGMGQGRGRGGMGMGMPSSLTYKLDGSETTVESGGGRPGTSTLKAEWKDDGKALELTSVRKFTNRDGEQRSSTSKERWELSADGKTLTINRASETQRGEMKSTLAFNKQ